MSQLPKEWERVRNQLLDGMDNPVYRVGVENTVERCYALANKPVRWLTDAEIEAISDKVEFAKFAADLAFARACIAAHQRKQQEPETVTFRAARNRNDHSEIYMAKADSDWSGSNWEWLPGEPQTIEVKLP